MTSRLASRRSFAKPVRAAAAAGPARARAVPPPASSSAPGAVVEDEKVGLQDIEDQIEAFTDLVQSIDMVRGGGGPFPCTRLHTHHPLSRST